MIAGSDQLQHCPFCILDFDIGSDMGHMVIGDDMKSLDIKDNLLAAASTVKHRHPLLSKCSELHHTYVGSALNDV